MNTKLLRKVQKFLLKEPRRFDMLDWLAPSAFSNTVLEKPPCGTTCCIAGAAFILDRKVEPGKALTEYETYQISVRDIATDALGLDLDQRERLFYTADWPVKYCVAYHRAKTQRQRVKVGVARIEHFIKTKGAE